MNAIGYLPSVGFCQCGCGRKTNIATRKHTQLGVQKGEHFRWISGHSSAKHRQLDSAEYRAWSHITQRCTNPKCKQWKDYGERGITICEKWRASFKDFLADVGPRPSLKHSIDRYPDNDGNYEPGNVRWATQKEQARNTRRNVWITFRGEAKLQKDWAFIIGVRFQTIQKHRIKGNLESYMERKLGARL